MSTYITKKATKTVTMVITLAFSGTVKSATVQQRLRIELRVPRPVKDDDLCCNSPGHVSYNFSISGWKLILLGGQNIILKPKSLAGETKTWSYYSHASHFSLRGAKKKFHSA